MVGSLSRQLAAHITAGGWWWLQQWNITYSHSSSGTPSGHSLNDQNGRFKNSGSQISCFYFSQEAQLNQSCFYINTKKHNLDFTKN